MSFEEMVTALGVTAMSCWTLVALVRAFFNRHRPQSATPLGAATDERLARIEQAVDAIAIEVERISEAQRFTTKLLAERSKEAL